MRSVYFDSCVFAKRYINEPGTAEVLHWCEQAGELAMSVIALPQMISAFCRLQSEGRLAPAALQLAVLALEASSLRGMDAIHIAAAQVCEADVFVSADARQCAAARIARLNVVAL